MANLQGKVIMVTGSAGGIGKAMVERCVADGANVILADLNLEANRKVVEELGISDDQALCVAVDITDKATLDAAVEKAVEKFGRIDGLAHCAGALTNGKFEDLTKKEIDFVIDINTKGTLYTFQAVGTQMLKQGKGKIAAIASKAGKIGCPNNAHYAASKFGVIGLVQTAAMEWGPRGVYVNCVCPGEVDTPMLRGNYAMHAEKAGMSVEEFTENAIQGILIRRIAPPSSIANVLAFLLSEDSDEIMGQSINTDGGIIFH